MLTSFSVLRSRKEDKNNEMVKLNEELARYRNMIAGDRGQALIPILRLRNACKKHVHRWHKYIFAEAHARAQLTCRILLFKQATSYRMGLVFGLPPS